MGRQLPSFILRDADGMDIREFESSNFWSAILGTKLVVKQLSHFLDTRTLLAIFVSFPHETDDLLAICKFLRIVFHPAKKQVLAWMNEDEVEVFDPNGYNMVRFLQELQETPNEFVDQNFNRVQIHGNKVGGCSCLFSNGECLTFKHQSSTRVVSQLLSKRFKRVVSNNWAFAAICQDGSVYAWGSPKYGGCDKDVALSEKLEKLKDVVSIFNTDTAFCALTADGQITTWGNPVDGGTFNYTGTFEPDKVQSVAGNSGAFCALDINGNVAVWGSPTKGGLANRAVLRKKFTKVFNLKLYDKLCGMASDGNEYCLSM